MNRMAKKLFCIYFFLLGLCCYAEERPVFRLPPAPKGQVSDEKQWLSEKDRVMWETQLAKWKTSDGVDMFLVILPSLQDVPADHVARVIGEKWGNPALCGVVLFVPEGDGPQVWWGGDVSDKVSQDPRARQTMIDRIERRARSEMSDTEQIGSAIRELSDTMRVLNAQWKQSQILRDKWNQTIFDKWTKQRLSKRTQVVIIVAASLLAISLLGVLWWRIKTHKKHYLFPTISPQRRFGASHAGGSGAVVSLAKTR